MKLYKYLLASLIGALFFGCATPNTQNDQKPNASLTGTYWKLMRVDSMPTILYDLDTREASMTLSASVDGVSKLKGYSDCNKFQGSYELDGKKIQISKTPPIRITRKSCGRSIQNKYMSALEAMRSYEIAGDKMAIFDENNNTLANFEAVYLY